MIVIDGLGLSLVDHSEFPMEPMGVEPGDVCQCRMFDIFQPRRGISSALEGPLKYAVSASSLSLLDPTDATTPALASRSVYATER
jgi:hypothetical protein